ncbi:MAG TPA: hypothetical protein VFY44_00440 [Thermoleophilaceae bacterium]|nr:hypothetical protein [Thermoleophilaceae bacterium]
MFSLGRIHIVVLGLLAALLVPTAVAAKSGKDKRDRGGKAPATIPLPHGFQPEGIAAGKGGDLFVGSIPTGAIWKGDAKRGTGGVLVPGREGRAAIGLKVDRRAKRIVVAGGPTGKAFVYGARDGRDIAQLQLAPAGQDTFVNDVTLNRRGAFFTDSRIKQIYRVRGNSVKTIPLTGDIAYATGNNANGIESAKGGRVLITVQTNTGKLFTVDPRTGVTDEIDLGGASLPNGDGLLLKGRTLYVVQNRLNKIAVVRLARNLGSGRVVREITNPAFDVPTTLAQSRKGLYTVNARFGIAPSPDNRYDVVRVGR